MKCLCLFLLTIIVISCWIKCDRDTKRLVDPLDNMKKAYGKDNKKVPVLEKLPDGILWEGWVKFIHFSGAKVNKPSNFFENAEYFHQAITNDDLKKMDKKGHLHIPSRFDFYAKLLNNEINFLSERDSPLIRNNESLEIDSILPLDLNNVWKSTIQNLGNFREGSCLQIFTNLPNAFDTEFNNSKDTGLEKNWVICTNKKKDRDELWKILISLKTFRQKKQQMLKEMNPPQTLAALTKVEAKPLEEKPSDYNSNDGFWILLQDWSQCTLKCGGGKTVQQWMCVPPKKGGKPCEGKAIREKPCNTKPCPGVSVLIPGMAPPSELNEVASPIVRSAAFTSRPQINLKCVRKESDVFYLWADNETSATKTKRPARIVMNNRTITLFNDENYENSVFTFDLKNTLIARDVKDDCCFSLASFTREFVICGGFGSPCNKDNRPYFVEEWMNDFNIFHNKCLISQKELNYKAAETKKALDDAQNQAGIDNLAERTDLIKKKMFDDNSSALNKKLQNTQSLALKVIKREINIEKLLQQEIQLKAAMDAKKLLELKKQELKKQECLMKLLKDREVENSRIRENKQAELQLEKIKEEARQEVLKKREQLRKNIENIKKKAERRTRQIEQDINVIRGQMAKNLIDANRNGDKKRCSDAYGIQPKINLYCDANIIEDYSKNIECKDPNDFCYICCENEFGNMFMNKRDDCYNMCDDLARKRLDRGEFLWGG